MGQVVLKSNLLREVRSRLEVLYHERDEAWMTDTSGKISPPEVSPLDVERIYDEMDTPSAEELPRFFLGGIFAARAWICTGNQIIFKGRRVFTYRLRGAW